MTCTWCREALSALLDGEDHPGERAKVEAHLDRCPGCRGYANRAARVTRLARTEPVVATPDLSAAVLTASARRLTSATPPGAPRRAPRLTSVLRTVLAVLGIGQVGLATNELFGPHTGQHTPNNLSGASLTQLAHECSAWNLALAVGFLCVAARPSRTRALLPLVGAFVAGLTVLGALDAVSGRVVGSRLASHGVVVLGLVVLLALARAVRQPTGPVPRAMGSAAPRFGGPQWGRLPSDAGMVDGADRGPHWHGGGHDLKPSARRHAA